MSTWRRKSPRNLLLLPFALLGMAGAFWILSRPIFFLRKLGMPEDTFLSSGTRIGLILFYVGLMMASIGPGLIFSNLCVGLISSAQKSNLQSSSRALIRFSLLILGFAYPVAWVGGMSFYSLDSDGVFYRGWFSLKMKRYEWRQLKQIRTQCYSKKSAGEATFVLNFDDGVKIDLSSSQPKEFFAAYPLMVKALEHTPFDFYYDPPPPLFSNHPCPKSWESYYARRP